MDHSGSQPMSRLDKLAAIFVVGAAIWWLVSRLYLAALWVLS